jgi:hypothetical protein
VKQPERGPRHHLQQPAKPADQHVADEQMQVEHADHHAAKRFGRGAREQREADREHIGEADIVDDFEGEGPAEADPVSGRGDDA